MIVNYYSAFTLQKPYINTEGDVTLPNDNSFFVFGSKSLLTQQIEAILHTIIEENQGDDVNSVLVKTNTLPPQYFQ